MQHATITGINVRHAIGGVFCMLPAAFIALQDDLNVHMVPPISRNSAKGLRSILSQAGKAPG